METVNVQRVVFVATLVVVAALLPAGVDAAALALAALPVWFSSIQVGSHRRALAGTVLAIGGISLAGIRELEPALLVFATLGAIVAWKSTTQVVSLRVQLDDTAEIERAFLAHTGSVLAATATVCGVIYSGFLLGPQVPPFALAMIFLGAVPILAGLEWLGQGR